MAVAHHVAAVVTVVTHHVTVHVSVAAHPVTPALGLRGRCLTAEVHTGSRRRFRRAGLVTNHRL